MSKRRAFTLIELIIVLTILAIVAAVAIPVFQNLQIQARNSAVRGAVGAVRQAISVYRSNEIVERRATGIAPSPGYPNGNQVQDIQDNGTVPKIMENGDLPKNPWARIHWNDPGLDEDSVAVRDNPPPGSLQGPPGTAWVYANDYGGFWANSAANGGAGGDTENTW